MSLNNTRGGADFQQCGQCYVGLCKKHPGQDSGRGAASLLAGAKAAQQSGQAALYDQLVGKKLERVKAEAVEQYKAQVKEAAEVERKTKFALPGGPKTGTGDVDISKLSSAEIGSLLQRNENG